MYVNRTKSEASRKLQRKGLLGPFCFPARDDNVKSSEIRSQVGRTNRQLLGFVN